MSTFWCNPWIINISCSVSGVLFGYFIQWAKTKLIKRDLHKLLWREKNTCDLKVIHGGYADIPTVAKKTRFPPNTSFPLQGPTDEVELISYCELYQEWGKLNGHPIDFVTDIFQGQEMDINMLTLGGPDYNNKTYDIIHHPQNKFITQWPTGGEEIKIDDNAMPFKSGQGEYGFIMRITSPEQKSWMVCAGFDALGTKGAGYFFAHQWERMKKITSPLSCIPFVKVPDFLFVIKLDEHEEPNYRESHIVAVFTQSKGIVKEIKKGRGARKHIVGYTH